MSTTKGKAQPITKAVKKQLIEQIMKGLFGKRVEKHQKRATDFARKVVQRHHKVFFAEYNKEKGPLKSYLTASSNSFAYKTSTISYGELFVPELNHEGELHYDQSNAQSTYRSRDGMGHKVQALQPYAGYSCKKSDLTPGEEKELDAIIADSRVILENYKSVLPDVTAAVSSYKTVKEFYADYEMFAKLCSVEQYQEPPSRALAVVPEKIMDNIKKLGLPDPALSV